MPYSAAKACLRFPARFAPEDEGARRAGRRGKRDSRIQPQGRRVRQVCVLDRPWASSRKSHAPAAAWRGRPSKERSPGNARPNQVLRGSPSIRRHSSCIAGPWRGPRLAFRPRPDGPPVTSDNRANLFVFAPMLGPLDRHLLGAALEPAAMPGPARCAEMSSKMRTGFGCAGAMNAGSASTGSMGERGCEAHFACMHSAAYDGPAVNEAFQTIRCARRSSAPAGRGRPAAASSLLSGPASRAAAAPVE